jgi:hypothetical protein
VNWPQHRTDPGFLASSPKNHDAQKKEATLRSMHRFWHGLGAGDPTVIVFNNTAVASNSATGPGVVRRTLLTNENEETGVRFDRLTLDTQPRFCG